MSESTKRLTSRAEQAMREGNILVALMQFEAICAQEEPSPEIMAKLGYCLAKERRQISQGAALCRKALQAEPANPDHYYQLGRIYLIARQKQRALDALRKGLKFRRYQPIIDQLSRMGARKQPVFSALPREHFLNRNCGKALDRIGLR
ncbi:MAG: tetratricopeptide repeat protein [Desulfuromonadales bacterium]|nr:tetratricopeptide repeat protein [Desulfuromonadales bacterium]